MPNKTGIRLLGVARNPANGFPARLLVLLSIEVGKVMEIFNSDWLLFVSVVVGLPVIFAVVDLAMWFVAFLWRNVPKWLRKYREVEGQSWRVPDRIRKWLDKLWLILLGYVGCMIVIMVAMTTILRGKTERVGPELFNQVGISNDDVALALAVVLAPIGLLLFPFWSQRRLKVLCQSSAHGKPPRAEKRERSW